MLARPINHWGSRGPGFKSRQPDQKSPARERTDDKIDLNHDPARSGDVSEGGPDVFTVLISDEQLHGWILSFTREVSHLSGVRGQGRR